jgi:Protein of unknown function (DUF1214)
MKCQRSLSWSIVLLSSVLISCPTNYALAEAKETQEAVVVGQDLRWQDYLELLKDQRGTMEYATVRKSADVDLAQYLFMTLSQAYSMIYEADPDYPEFVPYLNHILDIGSPNPDTYYLFTSLNSQNTYRISGHRGSVYLINFQIGYDFLGFSDNIGRTTLAKTMDEFAVNSDGTFEILLSRQRPEAYAGNWMPLDERADYMMVRQVAYGPSETNARMAIENLSDVSVAPRLNKDDKERQLRKMIDYVGQSAETYLGFLNALHQKGVYNRLEIPDWFAIGGVRDQVYQQGLYDVGDREALVVTVKAPEYCQYWNIQAGDLLWQAHDFMNTQSHLNGYLDRSDSDGLTRIILSHKDPGVANWIDLQGVTKGYMLMRWINCDETPEPVVEKVDFDQVKSVLPEDVEMITPEKRKAYLRQQAKALQLRRNW